MGYARGELVELGCGSGLAGIDEEDIGSIFGDIGRFLAKAAPAVLGVIGGAVGTVILPGVGTAIGSSLGSIGGKAISGAVHVGGGGGGAAPATVPPASSADIMAEVGISLPSPPSPTPVPGVVGLCDTFAEGPYRYKRCRGNDPITIRQGGWRLDTSKGIWYTPWGGMLSAVYGDTNETTGDQWPPVSKSFQSFISFDTPPPPPATPAPTVQQLISSLTAPPAAPASTVSPMQVAGVGAAGLLAFLVWRMAMK